MNTLLAQPIHPIQCKNNQRGSVNNTGSRANVQPSKQSPKSNASSTNLLSSPEMLRMLTSLLQQLINTLEDFDQGKSDNTVENNDIDEDGLLDDLEDRSSVLSDSTRKDLDRERNPQTGATIKITAQNDSNSTALDNTHVASKVGNASDKGSDVADSDGDGLLDGINASGYSTDSNNINNSYIDEYGCITKNDDGGAVNNPPRPNPLPPSSAAGRTVLLVPDQNSQGFLPTHPHDLPNILNQWNLPPLLSNEELIIFDVDGDNELSVGDDISIQKTVFIPPNIFGTEVFNHIITQADLLVIESDPIQSRIDFDANKQKWLDNHPSSYRYILDQNPGGIAGSDTGPEQPVEIIFQFFAFDLSNPSASDDGFITDAFFTSGLPDSIPSVNRRSIDDLFDIIDDALNQTTTIPVVIQYNTQFGYPESIHIDYVPAAADDELDYIISDFIEGMIR